VVYTLAIDFTYIKLRRVTVGMHIHKFLCFGQIQVRAETKNRLL
jgi:hypothetical protein